MAIQKLNQNIMNQNAVRTSSLLKSPAPTVKNNSTDIAKINAMKNPSGKGQFDNKGIVLDKKA